MERILDFVIDKLLSTAVSTFGPKLLSDEILQLCTNELDDIKTGIGFLRTHYLKTSKKYLRKALIILKSDIKHDDGKQMLNQAYDMAIEGSTNMDKIEEKVESMSLIIFCLLLKFLVFASNNSKEDIEKESQIFKNLCKDDLNEFNSTNANILQAITVEHLNKGDTFGATANTRRKLVSDILRIHLNTNILFYSIKYGYSKSVASLSLAKEEIANMSLNEYLGEKFELYRDLDKLAILARELDYLLGDDNDVFINTEFIATFFLSDGQKYGSCNKKFNLFEVFANLLDKETNSSIHIFLKFLNILFRNIENSRNCLLTLLKHRRRCPNIIKNINWNSCILNIEHISEQESIPLPLEYILFLYKEQYDLKANQNFLNMLGNRIRYYFKDLTISEEFLLKFCYAGKVMGFWKSEIDIKGSTTVDKTDEKVESIRLVLFCSLMTFLVFAANNSKDDIDEEADTVKELCQNLLRKLNCISADILQAYKVTRDEFTQDEMDASYDRITKQLDDILRIHFDSNTLFYGIKYAYTQNSDFKSLADEEIYKMSLNEYLGEKIEYRLNYNDDDAVRNEHLIHLIKHTKEELSNLIEFMGKHPLNYSFEKCSFFDSLLDKIKENFDNLLDEMKENVPCNDTIPKCLNISFMIMSMKLSIDILDPFLVNNLDYDTCRLLDGFQFQMMRDLIQSLIKDNTNVLHYGLFLDVQQSYFRTGIKDL